MANQTKRLTQDDLRVLIDNEVRQSYGYGDGKLEQLRYKNLYYFLAEPKEDLAPPEIDGRSRVVDTTVRNTVLGMEGPLLKTFYGSDNVFEFEETKSGDEPLAKTISAYINHIYRNKNPGYTITATWIREALLMKKGIVKVWWDESDIETREEYNGQTDVQLAILLDDEEIEVIDQKSYPDEEAKQELEKAAKQLAQQMQQVAQAAQQEAAQGQPGPATQQLQQLQQQAQQMDATPEPLLYDVAVKRVKTGGRLCIENVPPEEFLISKRAKCIADSPFTAHRVQRTVAQLRAAGYKLGDNVQSDDSGAQYSIERIERLEFISDDTMQDDEGIDIDPSQELVWIVESYLQVDMDGDGIPEWRKVVKSGTQILDDQECDGPPFVALGAINMPHQFFDLCPADLALESQKIKTSLKRAQLDNINLQVNGRNFAVEGQVNLDDLLNTRPGGVVRVKNPQAVGRLDQGIGDVAGSMQLMEMFEAETEEATGWTRQTQGGNGMQLQQTATQSNIITNRADSRIESISRYMAETGFKELGEMIFKLVTQYQKKAEMVKLNGEWVNVDPREWTNQFNLTVNVGLGTGNKDQLVSHLNMLGAMQMNGLQIGVAKPENIYKTGMKLANALGFRNGDDFFSDPRKTPPAPPPVDPNVAKIQAQQQQHQAEMQMKAQQAEADRAAMLQTKQMEAQVQMEVDRNRQTLEAEQQRLKAENEMALETQREQNRMQESAAKIQLERDKLAIEQYRIDKQQETAIVTAQIAAQQQNDSALVAAEAAANEGVANGNA